MPPFSMYKPQLNIIVSKCSDNELELKFENSCLPSQLKFNVISKLQRSLFKKSDKGLGLVQRVLSILRYKELQFAERQENGINYFQVSFKMKIKAE